MYVVVKCFIALVFIKHGLNDTAIPWQYGMKCKLQRLNREWKGNLAFNIYASQLIFETTDLLVDQKNGHPQSSHEYPPPRLGEINFLGIVNSLMVYLKAISTSGAVKCKLNIFTT